MLFNIFRYCDTAFDIYPVEYTETIEAPDAETAILRFAEKKFGVQNAFKPNRWSHLDGTDLIGHKYYGFFKAVPYDCKFPQK